VRGVRRLGGRLAIAALAFVATLLAAEVTVRIATYRGPDVIPSHPEIFYFERKPPLRYGPYGDLVPGETLWRIGDVPYLVSVNAQGLRNDRATPPAGDVILAVGDSFTFGAYVPNADTWPAQLEGLLRRKWSGLQVANAGIAGYGIVQERAYLVEKGLAFQPRLVILAFNPNDIELDLRPARLAVQRRPRDEHPLRSLLRRSAAATWVNAVGVAWKREQAERERATLPQAPSGNVSDDYAAYAREFEAVTRLLHGARIPLVVVAFPQIGQLMPRGCDDRPQRFVEELSRTAGVPFLDLAPAFRRRDLEDLYLGTNEPRAPAAGGCVAGTHPSRAGYRVAAVTIAEWLETLGLP
jgi:lysophospholipase L1-like esterase